MLFIQNLSLLLPGRNILSNKPTITQLITVSGDQSHCIEIPGMTPINSDCSVFIFHLTIADTVFRLPQTPCH